MEVTFSIDDQILARVQLLAQRRGTSIEQMIHEYLENLVANDTRQAVVELERLWREGKGSSGGRTWTREDAYDRPVFR
jgi:hypothetical protein